MSNIKILILGASGFVGGNIADVLKKKQKIDTVSTSRTPSEGKIYFDLLDYASWKNIIDINPNFIIDATGYGVVKEQTNLDMLYNINYIVKASFIDYLYQQIPDIFWIQIGTAFEYSLEQELLTEKSLCFPKTHYGISKALFSSFLIEKIKRKYCIIRPFGMFGEAESISKFFPMLILAQKEKRKVDLSDGNQQRDYFYVKDLADFLYNLIESKLILKLEGEIINVGSGNANSLKQLSNILASQIIDFEPQYWNWGKIPQRAEENSIFYNGSTKAKKLGFITTNLETAFKKTADYYYKNLMVK